MTVKPLLIILLIAQLALSACDSILLQDTTTAVSDTPVPALETTSAEPSEVLQAFITAWDNKDYEAMYRLTANRSRALYPQQKFIDQYTAAESVMRFAGVSHELNNVEYQGSTAIVNYDIIIESSANTFGAIADEDRVMRLIQEGGWKVAWSTMDIFDGMSSRARLTERTDFPSRANIYDRDGGLLAEEDGLVYSLYAVKQDMNSVDACIRTLATLTRQQTSTLTRTFSNYLAETRFHIAEIDAEQYQQNRQALASDCAIIRQEGDPFSKVRVSNSRSYFGHGIAMHLVGFIGAVPNDELERWQARGYSAGDLIGRAGIELAFQDVLAGQPQRYLRIVESGGTVIDELAGATGAAPRSLTLTVNRDLQRITAQTMADAMNYALPNWGGITAGGAIVALDVNSGALLALVSYPNFDPQVFNPKTEYRVVDTLTRLQNDIRDPFGNKALAEQYTPGSTYKIVTALAAASEDVWDGEREFDCQYIWRGGERFNDARPQRTDWRVLETPPRPPAGLVTMANALAASCNPFFYEMGALLYQQDADLQANYAELLGLGVPTGIQGVGIEAAGNVAHPGEITEAINNAIGQGSVTVSVLQMAQLTSLIANGGTLWQPYVVSHLGTRGEPDYEVVNRPIVARELDLNAEALAIVRDGMCKVTTVDNLGTAEFVFRHAEVPSTYSLCGKTGTAETAGNPHAWFVAYWPAEEPQIAFAGVMAHSREGSEVVAPMIRRILDDHLGAPQNPFPDWWQDPYNPLKTQQQALADLQASS